MKKFVLATLATMFLFEGWVLAADWENDIRRTCAFLNIRQRDDGAVEESEHLDHTHLVDTCRALHPWAFYSATFSDQTFKTNLDLAYEYLSQNRPESEIPLYNALDCCANVLFAAPFYVEAFGDLQYETFHTELATFIANATPDYSSPPDLFAMSQAVLGIYRWATYHGDATYISAAESLAQGIQAVIEADPTLLNRELAEESGGMAFCAIADAAFHSTPQDRKAWVEAYASNLEVDLNSGIYSNCHLAWYGNAHYLAWRYGAETATRDAYYNIMTNLLLEDPEGDGGIPNRKGGTSTKDTTWASSNMVLTLTEFGPEIDVEIASSNYIVPSGSQTEIDFGLANNTSNSTTAFLLIFMDIPGFGLRYLGVFSFALPGGFSFSQEDIPLKIAAGSPPGAWTLRVDVYNGSGGYQESEEFPFTVL